MAPKATVYGLVIVGSVLSLHLGSSFLKPFVAAKPEAEAGRRANEEEFVQQLKKL